MEGEMAKAIQEELASLSFFPEPLRLVVQAVKELHEGASPSMWTFAPPAASAVQRAANVVKNSRGAYVPDIVRRVPVGCFPTLVAWVLLSLEAFPESLPAGLTAFKTVLGEFDLMEDLLGLGGQPSTVQSKEARRASDISTAASEGRPERKKQDMQRKLGKTLKEERAERRAARRENVNPQKAAVKGPKADVPKEVKSRRRTWAVPEDDEQEAEAASCIQDEEVVAALCAGDFEPTEGVEMLPSSRARRKGPKATQR